MKMENEITDDRIYEWNNETQSGIKDEWVSENLKELMGEFIEDNTPEFNNFLENEIIDDERNIEYWTEVFCKEEKEDEFNDFCNDRFKDNDDIEKTNRSYRK